FSALISIAWSNESSFVQVTVLPAFTEMDLGPKAKSFTVTLSVAVASVAGAVVLSLALVDVFASLPPHAPRSAKAATALTTTRRRWLSGFRIEVGTVAL